jgi:protocatechuate 3,4-dioxygenase beta subunit
MMNERLNAITTRLTEHLHSVIEEFQITEDELKTALHFLTEVGKSGEFPLLSDVLHVSIAVDRVTHAAEHDGKSTESNVEGPLYREEAPILSPPVHLCAIDETEEEILYVSGQIVSTGGEPLADTVIDVWQANGKGDYENEDPTQPEFNLRGRFLTDENGRYEFQTVVPGPYEIVKGGPVGELLRAIDRHAWRPAHIHFKIQHAEFKPVTTMLFIEGDPWVDSDSIGAVKESLMLKLEDCNDPKEMLSRGINRKFYKSNYDFILSPA